MQTIVSDDVSRKSSSVTAPLSPPAALEAPAEPRRHPPGLAGQPVVCPVLIGRTATLEALQRAVDAAGRGQGRIVLISGEAGVGKSRLAAEAKTYAAGRGFLVLESACFPQDRMSPYAPVLDMLRAQFAELAPAVVAEAVGPFAREIAWLLPELLPGVSGPSFASLDPKQQRGRLFAALTHVLTGQPGARAVLLVVDDLQWADDATLDVLLHLARRAAGSLVLLGTCRTDDDDPRLSAWLAQLDRARLSHEISIAPLGRDEVGAMLVAIFGERTVTPSRVLDAIFDLTEGNPFVVEELVAALVRGGAVHLSEDGWHWREPSPAAWRLPRSLRGAVQQRIDRLSPAAREIVSLAAVVGRRFDFELLQRLARVDEWSLLAVVKELIAAQVIVEESQDRFAFRHVLTRQAIYDELLTRERATLHRAVAEAAEQLDADAPNRHLDDLAYHFSQAKVWGKALAYAHQAGKRACRLHAPRAAVEHLTRALEAAEQGRGNAAPVPTSTLIAVHHERGRAFEQLGDFDRGRTDYELAVTLAREAGRSCAEWEGLIDLGTLWTSRDYVQAGTAYQQALELARSIHQPRLIAHSLNRVGNWQINTAQPRDAIPLHCEAMTIFEQLGDRPGVAATLELLGMASYLSADLPASIAAFERAAVLFRALDDRPRLISSLAMLTSRGGDDLLGSAVADAAPLAEATRNGEQAVELARSIEWRAGEAFALFRLARTLGLRGAYGRALELARRSLRIAEEIEHRQWAAEAHWVLGALHLDLLALADARRHLGQALELGREVRSAFWVQVVTGYLAWAYVLSGDLERAAALLGPAAETDAPVQSLGERWLTFAQVQRALACGEAALALRLVDRLSAPSLDGTPSQETPRPALLRARALTALGRYAEAETVLRAVEAVTRAQGAQALLWRTLVLLGDLYRAWQRPEDAEREYAAARTVVESLAAGLTDDPLREALLQGVTAMLPRPSRISTRRAEAARFGGLSVREREVATLIARGLTNREIADELVIGERTIETHASNILNKLGLTSRREIARWAAERGPLLDPR
jgi:DNA-binding CsgD family transcriptional regulator/tetratricopeptide (TPR) repeat protein